MRLHLLVFAFCALQVVAVAQQSSAPASQDSARPQPAAPAQGPDTTQEKNSTQQKTKDQKESQRVLGVLPQFGVVNQKDARPLTAQQKFRLFYKSAFDPAEFAVTGLEAGIDQAEDAFPGYGQGAAGYGRRYGAAFGDQVTSGFFTNYFYPSLLHHDPRYYRLGEGGFKRRLGHALVQELIAHKDFGGRTFAWSNALGALSSGAISNAYYPDDDRGFGLTMSRAGISLLYGSLGGLEDEFWPDVYRKLRHRKPSSVPGDQAPKQ